MTKGNGDRTCMVKMDMSQKGLVCIKITVTFFSWFKRAPYAVLMHPQYAL